MSTFFVNGEFDIDMVMSKSKRKKVMSMNLSEADLVAPLDSHRMDITMVTAD